MSTQPAIKFKYESIQNPQAWRFLEAWRRGGEAELTLMNASSGWYSESRRGSTDFLRGKFGSGNQDALFVADDDHVEGAVPSHALDLTYGPHTSYNWEALFHVPMFLAIRNKEAGDYESALYWLQMVFDPRQPLDAVELRWRFAPLQAVMEEGAEPPAHLAQFSSLLTAWRQDPYNPWLIARARPSSLRKWVVANYLECLVRLGDELFEQDTMESVNEAAALYLVAHRVVGPEPVLTSNANSVAAAPTAAGLFAGGFMIDAEDVLDHGTRVAVQGQSTPDLASWSVGFCVPDNPMADTWRSTIADRLFKIRNSLDIRGVRRELPFFAPPIDPALLVRARAEGLSIQQALNQSSNPAGFRAQTLLSLAMEFTQDVRGFGSAILSALEKRDAEHLGRLRQNHEMVILTASRVQRERAVEEARVQRSVLQERLASTQARIEHYKVLLGPGSGLGGAELPPGISSDEAAEQASIEAAEHDEHRAGELSNDAARNAALPSLELTMQWGFPDPPKFGTSAGVGTQLITATYQYYAQRRERMAARHRAASARSAASGRNARRTQEWKHALDQAQREARTIEREILGADLRIQSMAFEAAQLEQQIEHNAEITEYLKGKFTNEELYHWMVEQLTQLHDVALKLAVSMARRAADALRTELLPDESTDVLSFRLAREKRGLLAGDTLLQDLRKLQEFRVLRAPASELETTTRYSLRSWDPLKLLRLRHPEGSDDYGVEFAAAREVFDADFPLHWKRRIRSVAVTIPAVVASGSGVRATVRLIGSSMEDSSGGLSATGAPSRDEIVTSTGVEDIGFADEPSQAERYRPFELAGAVSKWRVEILPEANRLDRRTIEDVILQIRHIARNKSLSSQNSYNDWRRSSAPDLDIPSHPLHLIDVASQYPDQWRSWVANGGDLLLPVRQDQLEHVRDGEEVEVKSMRLLAEAKPDVTLPNSTVVTGPWKLAETDSDLLLDSSAPADIALGVISGTYALNDGGATRDGDLVIRFVSPPAPPTRSAIRSLYVLVGYNAS